VFFDSHAHYNDEKFDFGREELILSFKDNKVSNFVNVSDSIRSSYKCIDIAEKYDFAYCSVGVHPHEVKNMTESDLDTIKKLCEHEKVVAIGEIGLDYYYNYSPKDVQKKWFERQLILANEINVPVIIHMRDATEDTVNIIRENPVPKGVLHCFSGSVETAKIALNLGYYISFAGPLTFKNAKGILDVAKYVPDDRILIETDSPYLSPEPVRGKRNSSLHIHHIAEKLAELRGTDVTNIAKITSDNAKELFNIR